MTADSKLGDNAVWHTLTRYVPISFVGDYSKLEEGLKEYFPGGIDVTFENATAEHVAQYKIIGLRDSPDKINLHKFLTEGEYILK
ncbi:hypothetical protein FMEXI_14544, partial [Fusarium mexicanum]